MAAGRTQKARNKELVDQIDISELVMSDPVITAAVYTAEQASRDLSKPYFPATLKRIVITSDEIEGLLSHAELSDDSLRELNLMKKSEMPDRRMKQSVMMSEEVLSPLMSSLNLSAYDRAVLEAIYSQILASPYESNCLFSIRSLFRTMCGADSGELSCTSEQKQMLCNTIMRLMGTVVTIEMQGVSRKGTEVSRKVSFNLVNAKIEEVNIGGMETTSVRITSYPEFLAFAREKGGITGTPIDMLNIPSISMTVRNTAIVNYLQHQVSNVTFSRRALDNRNSLPRRDELYLSYAPIYEIAEIKPIISAERTTVNKYSRTYTNRVRTTVHKILDCWVEKGYIRSWADVCGANKHIHGVSVFLYEGGLPMERFPELAV